MHEMALAEGILGVVLDASEGQVVKRVRLRVGRLQHVAPESLQFSFQLVGEGTPASEAVLEIEEVSARLRCAKCGAESEFDSPPFNCRHCGASEVEVISGDELLVDAVELEGGVTIQRPDVANQGILEEILEDHIREHEMDGSDHKDD